MSENTLQKTWLHAEGFSESVKKFEVGDKTIYIIGTAHVSKQSVEDVSAVIEGVKPDTILIELCEKRYQSIKNPEQWKDKNIFEIIKKGEGMMLLANLMLSSFQKKIGDKLDVKPGQEMITAMVAAEDSGAHLELGDRDLKTTLTRVWRSLGFFEKSKLCMSGLESLFVNDEIDESEVDRMKNEDVLTDMLKELGKSFPSLSRVLIHERDLYLMSSIREAPGNCVVAVVGAGHVPGIISHWRDPVDRDELNSLPPPGNTLKILKWAVPSIILLAFVYGFSQHDFGWNMVKAWVLSNGVLSALGALLAWGHPLTILAAFIAAPITSLNPFIGAGMVTGVVELALRKPMVSDFENIQKDASSLRGVYKNRICRTLLVVFLSSFGSAIGTWVGAAWVIKILS